MSSQGSHTPFIRDHSALQTQTGESTGVSGAQNIQTDQRPRIAERRVARVLIEQPNEDVRELLAEHCRRLGLEPLIAGANGNGHLPDVDLIVAEPASADAQRLLAAHRERRSTTPIVFVSIYPPTGVLSSPAVAYLVMPCSRERFERAVASALAASSNGR